MYELSENPAENSKRHLRALPGIPDMWEGLRNHPAASRLPGPHLAPHPTCPAGRSSGQPLTLLLHPPKEPLSILPCRALCPGRRLLPMLSPNLPG